MLLAFWTVGTVMTIHLLVRLVLSPVIVTVGKEIYTLDNFNGGDMVFGVETLIKDYAVLANDPLSSLPSEFTICSSLFLQYMTANKNFFQLFQKDGSHWLHVEVNMERNLQDFEDRIIINFDGKEPTFAMVYFNRFDLNSW